MRVFKIYTFNNIQICNTVLLTIVTMFYIILLAFPGGASGKQPVCQCRRHKRGSFDPWVRKIPWRRAWQPTPVFWPGESHLQRSLTVCSPWGHKELDTTEATYHTCTHIISLWLTYFITGSLYLFTARGPLPAPCPTMPSTSAPAATLFSVSVSFFPPLVSFVLFLKFHMLSEIVWY